MCINSQCIVFGRLINSFQVYYYDLLFFIAVIVIGLNPVTQEVHEGSIATINMEILFGSLEKDVVVTLTSLEQSAKGMGYCITVG